ncbi:MAG: phosphotransferase, partial [Proteobacteria bacterium]|nr:phosphotransferase [Pseudomonadota bacterium]
EKEFEKIILDATGADNLFKIEVIQQLWSGYGNIIRYGLEGGRYRSVVVKHICLKGSESHPRGWNTDYSHNRKVQSYLIEMNWYENWSRRVTESSPIPECLAITRLKDEYVIVLEDLDEKGYPLRKTSVTIGEMERCLKWLADFHMTFLDAEPDGLWDIGCYWHLDTRPQELEALDDLLLKEAASSIENRLNSAGYITIVHGDAKLANFCFSDSGAAMVDFQY